MPARQETPVSPSAQDILDANASVTPLRPRRAGLRTTLTATGLLIASPFLEGCTPIGGFKPDASTKADILDQAENLAQDISERVRTFKDYYWDPTGRKHYRVEVQDPNHKYQCTDAVQALSTIYGIPIDATRHASAKDYLSPTPTTNDWFTTFSYDSDQSLQILPPEGSIVVFNEKVGDENGHVGISLGTGEITQGNIEFDVISQNYGGQSIEVHRFNANDDGLTGWLYPSELGPEGTPPPRELAFTVDATLPPRPIETPRPTFNSETPKPTSEVSELSEQQQAYYYAAEHFFAFLSKPAPYEIASEDFWGEESDPYVIEKNNLVLPEGITLEEIQLRLAKGEIVSLSQPIEYNWIQTYVNQDHSTTKITSGRALFNDLRMDNTSFSGFPWYENISTADARNGINFKGYSHLFASISYSGVRGRSEYIANESERRDFFDRVRNTPLPELGPWEEFDLAFYAILSRDGNSFFPDLLAGRDSYSPLVREYNTPVDPDFFEIIDHPDWDYITIIEP